MNKLDIEKEISEKGSQCWDNIGVYGSCSCELLEQYEHCRSCPIYLYSGRMLFKKNADESYINDWTKLYAQEKESDKQQKRSVVMFRIQEEWFAIDTGLFQEAVANKMIHIVPGRTNKYLYGIVNVNGELFLSIALESFLGLNRESDNSLNSKKLLVLCIDKQRYCFPIDEYDSVTGIKVDDFEEIPNTLNKMEDNIIESVFRNTYKYKENNETKTRERVVSLISNEKLIFSLNRYLLW